MIWLESTAGLLALSTLLGLCIGSFLNVVIHRLPKMMEREWHVQCAELRGENVTAVDDNLTLCSPSSRCTVCHHAIRPIDNIPVLSFLFLQGKCKSCRSPISIRYPLIEVFTALISALVAWHFGPTLQTAGALLLVWTLIALAMIDFDTQLLPDSLTLPLLWLGLLFNVFGTYTSLTSAVIGAMAGYLSLWSIFWLFKLATGKEGMGYGDFKLLAALGAWLGWSMLPTIILLSSLVGATVGISLIVFARHGRNIPIPFGPYLAAAGVIALLWGARITQSYLGQIS